MRSRMDRRRCTSIPGGSRRRADPLGPGACDCYGGVDRSRGLGEHPLCGPVWSPQGGLFASALCAERLPSRPSGAGYFSFSNLSHRLIEGYNLILTSFEGGLGLVVGSDVLEFFQLSEHALVLFDRQDDAHGLAVLVRDVTGIHYLTSLSL